MYKQCTKRKLQELRVKVDEAELAMKKVKFMSFLLGRSVVPFHFLTP